MDAIARRRLGNTDMDVSLLGLGTVKLGRNQGVKYPEGFALPNDRQARALLALALDHGINLLDTAPAYGISEARLGSLLRGQRHHWLLCTKVGEEYEDGQSRFDFSPDHTRYSIERSLRRLNTDVLDLVLVHSDGNDLDIIERFGTLDALAGLKSEGKLRAYGMSTKTVEGGLRAAAESDVVMVTWNLADDQEVPVIDYCAENGVGVLIKKALASGHLTGRPSSDLAARQGSDNIENPVKKAFSMIFAHPGVSSAIVGTINPRHLLDNILCLRGIT